MEWTADLCIQRQARPRALLVVLIILALFSLNAPPAAAQLNAADLAALDVTCDGFSDIGDALAIAQLSVGTRFDGGDCPLSDPATQINASRSDVNDDGFIDVGDALIVAQCTVGIPNTACPAPPPALLALRGLNLAGAEFGSDRGLGTQGVDYQYPTTEGIDFFLDAGMNTIRLPFLWERLQRTQGAEFEAAEFASLNEAVTHITERGSTVILDPHNYAAYFENPIGSDEVPIQAFADFWAQLAEEYKNNDLVVFGLMNEPIGISQQVWIDAANAAILAIRSTGASNLILVPGLSYTGAWSWFATNGDEANATAVLNIDDPGDNIAIEVHQYMDLDSSGTNSECASPTIGSERLAAFTEWLRDNGRRGFLGEFGATADDLCLAALDDMLDHVDANADVWLGWTYWAAGPLWPQSYRFEIEPVDGVSDDPQLPILLSHIPAG